MLILSQHQFFVSTLKWQENTSSHCLPAHLSYTKCHTWITAVHQFGPVKLHVKYVAGQGPLLLLRQGYSTVSAISLQLCKALEKTPGSINFMGSGAAGSRATAEWNRAQSNCLFNTQLHKGHCNPHRAAGTANTHRATDDLSRQTTDNKSKRQNKKVS